MHAEADARLVATLDATSPRFASVADAVLARQQALAATVRSSLVAQDDRKDVDSMSDIPACTG